MTLESARLAETVELPGYTVLLKTVVTRSSGVQNRVETQWKSVKCTFPEFVFVGNTHFCVSKVSRFQQEISHFWQKGCSQMDTFQGENPYQMARK